MDRLPIVDLNKDRADQASNGCQSAFYIPKIGEYFFSEMVPWIAAYERFYHISKEDYELFSSDIAAFNSKYAREHAQKQNCFTENFAGSAALRDYDGANGFQHAFPSKLTNPFQHYAYADGVLYAIIAWEHETILVPPVQAVEAGEGWSYPLREKCVLQNASDGKTPICYKLKGVWLSDGDTVIKVSDHEGSKPSLIKVKCPSCHHVWTVIDSNIPTGEKHEVTCPHCGTLHMRKKI